MTQALWDYKNNRNCVKPTQCTCTYVANMILLYITLHVYKYSKHAHHTYSYSTYPQDACKPHVHIVLRQAQNMYIIITIFMIRLVLYDTDQVLQY